MSENDKVKNNNNNNRRGEEESGGGIPMSIAMKRHFELEIDTLQNAPRNIDKLKRLLQAKQREYERATDIMDTQRLVRVYAQNVHESFFCSFILQI